MSTSTTDVEEPEAEVIELEPTMHIDTAEPWASRAESASFQGEAVMAAAAASQASMTGENDALLRARLSAASIVAFPSRMPSWWSGI